MSSSPLFTTFAVAGGLNKGPIGAGLGQYLARALVKEQGAKEVRILGRAGSASTPAAAELSSLGIKIVEVDYNSPSSLASALEGIDVVLSTLAGAGLAAQAPLGLAAKKAGVQLFVPSDFGPSTATVSPDSPIYAKVAIVHQLKEMGLPVLRVFCGIFADWVKVCINVDTNNEIIIVGEGKALISWTSRGDVAEFLTYILTHLPPSVLLTLDPLSLEASSTNLLSLASLLLAAHPNATVVHKSHAWAKARGAEGDFLMMLKIWWDLGMARSYEREEELEKGRGLWKEWHPKGVEELLVGGEEMKGKPFAE